MLTIAQVSDVHFGREHRPALAALQAMLEGGAFDAMVVAGDLTQHGRHHQFRTAAQWLKQCPVPVITVPGNHDVPQLNIAIRLSEPFDRYRRYIGPGTVGAEAMLEVDGLIMRGLNTARGVQMRRNWAEGSVNLADLEQALTAQPPLSILVCHHPLLSPSVTPWPTATRRGIVAVDRIAASSVELVLSGHVHMPSADLVERAQGRYLAVTSGTLSSRLREHPPSFNRLVIEPEAITVETQTYEAGDFHPTASSVWDRADLQS